MSDQEIQSAVELDLRGLEEAKMMTESMRVHASQISDLAKRRKALFLRLRKQRITYREMSEHIGISKQLIYKIIKDDLEIEYDPITGKRKRNRGRQVPSTTD